MTISKILSEVGYSEEFINIIENSFVEDSFKNELVVYEDQPIRNWDSTSCFIAESEAPIVYGEL